MEQTPNKGHYLDIETWKRRAQFNFFSRFDQPFFNLCVEVPVGATQSYCKQESISYFLASWYLCLRALNATEAFRYRLRGERVWVHERIHVGSTVLGDDDTFSFAYIHYDDSFSAFAAKGRAAVDAAKQQGGLNPLDERDDLVHGSVIPWLSFTSVAHARHSDPSDSVPKITFGRYHKVGDSLMMPLSVEAHHALLDGLDVARFVERFEALLAEPGKHLGQPGTV